MGVLESVCLPVSLYGQSVYRYPYCTNITTFFSVYPAQQARETGNPHRHSHRIYFCGQIKLIILQDNNSPFVAACRSDKISKISVASLSSTLLLQIHHQSLTSTSASTVTVPFYYLAILNLSLFLSISLSLVHTSPAQCRPPAPSPSPSPRPRSTARPPPHSYSSYSTSKAASTGTPLLFLSLFT